MSLSLHLLQGKLELTAFILELLWGSNEMFAKNSVNAWQIVRTQTLIPITNIKKVHNGSESDYLDSNVNFSI